jgi:hypothetical protein
MDGRGRGAAHKMPTIGPIVTDALRDKIAENDTSLTGHQAMDRARARMTRRTWTGHGGVAFGRSPFPDLQCVGPSRCSETRFG